MVFSCDVSSSLSPKNFPRGNKVERLNGTSRKSRELFMFFSQGFFIVSRLLIRGHPGGNKAAFEVQKMMSIMSNTKG